MSDDKRPYMWADSEAEAERGGNMAHPNAPRFVRPQRKEVIDVPQLVADTKLAKDRERWIVGELARASKVAEKETGDGRADRQAAMIAITSIHVHLMHSIDPPLPPTLLDSLQRFASALADVEAGRRNVPMFRPRGGGNTAQIYEIYTAARAAAVVTVIAERSGRGGLGPALAAVADATGREIGALRSLRKKLMAPTAGDRKGRAFTIGRRQYSYFLEVARTITSERLLKTLR